MTRSQLAAVALLALVGFLGVRLHAFLAAASGINAKVLCSAVFVSGRKLEEARANSLLIDRIGIRRQILETDVRGNFVLSGFDYGTARNWARLGLLYLRDGVFNGERLLPEGFVRFVATPAPAWKEPVYGGSFRINGTGRYSLPPEAFYMSGNGGQRVFVVPSHDLVIVRMGHTRGGATADSNLRAAQSLILEAIEAPKDAG